MKLFILTLFLSLTVSAEVTVQDCLDDALTFANHERAVTPLPECASIIDNEEDRVEVVSGKIRAFGKGRMIYVDTKDATGVIVERTLLSGDQTELVSIRKIFIDPVARRLFVIQVKAEKYELLVFNLDFLGNVTPLNVMRSQDLLSDVSSVKASDGKRIEIINEKGKFLINSDAESRLSRSVQKALTITPQ